MLRLVAAPDLKVGDGFDCAAVIERADKIHGIDGAFANPVGSSPRLPAQRSAPRRHAKPTSAVVYARHPWEKPGLTPPGLPRAADVVYAYRQVRHLVDLLVGMALRATPTGNQSRSRPSQPSAVPRVRRNDGAFGG